MREREPEVEAPGTGLARERTTLADEVMECFEGFAIGGGDYVVELTEPDAPATSGASSGSGEQQLQHLRLRPRREGYPPIIAGSVNPVEKHAELRTFEHASLVHEVRFGKGPEVTAPEWEQLLRKCENVLQLANIESARVGPSPSLLTESRKRKLGRRISPAALIAFVVVMAMALVVAFRVAQKLLH